ncbi:hypothetical protein TSAR_003094 [Trichomalopsis sarcophagae]|uniref:Uncharacterized protein n=1 Tax=Trichomalopsis sarcophagae TaxID=543379 RepID=A0A232EFZ7_9HYME|nr:hypothetical protein TSAR_003094 [Trichomalopsis sarcophagae]
MKLDGASKKATAITVQIQSRLRSRSPCGSEDYFEASTPKKSKVMEQEQNEFLSRNDTLLLSRSSGGSKEQSRGVMELEGGQPTRQSRPRSRSPDGSKDQRRKVMGLQKKNTTSAVQSLGSPEFRVRIPESQQYLTTDSIARWKQGSEKGRDGASRKATISAVPTTQVSLSGWEQ